MSNQVYSNQNSKYYDFPGLNAYTCSAPIPVASLATVTVHFNETDINNDPTIIDNTDISGIEILKPGMYSFMAVVNASKTASPTALDWDYRLTMTIDRPGQFTGLALSSVKTRQPGRGSDTGSEDRIASVNGVFYATTGDIIKIIYQNYTTDADTILTGGTILTINKIY